MIGDDFILAMALATFAGLSVPAGAILSFATRWLPRPISKEFYHFVMAFGAGALVSAVALVLVPEGIARLSGPVAVASFAMGGAVFLVLDRALAQRGGHAAQFMAMLLDYLPEAMALGALLTGAHEVAVLMAALIVLQNLPESFNAFREMVAGGMGAGAAMGLFCLMVPVGPIAAAVGMYALADQPAILGAIMMFSSGGILYLLFQDVAPQVPVERSWLPPFGAVMGFMLGLSGHILTLG